MKGSTMALRDSLTGEDLIPKSQLTFPPTDTELEKKVDGLRMQVRRRDPEQVGFKPTRPSGLPDSKSGAIVHSATAPRHRYTMWCHSPSREALAVALARIDWKCDHE